MRFVIAGASGFLGQALAAYLTSHGHDIVRLVRREPSSGSTDEAPWDPGKGQVDQGLIDDADVVVNLAGAPLVHVPWTKSYRETFLASRVDTTRTLAVAVAKSAASRGADQRRPALIAQSGIAGYGDHGAEVITEDTPIDADTFMGEVVRRWEAACEPAAEAGARVVQMRTGVVLDRRGGALKAMLPAFRLGLGGKIGSGEQFFSTISLDDWIAAAVFLCSNDDLDGPFNLTGPDPSTNAEFTRVLGETLRRPTVLRVPTLPLRSDFLAGPMGGEMLASARVEPRRLQHAGYAFAHDDVLDRIQAALR